LPKTSTIETMTNGPFEVAVPLRWNLATQPLLRPNRWRLDLVVPWVSSVAVGPSANVRNPAGRSGRARARVFGCAAEIFDSLPQPESMSAQARAMVLARRK
jgi:hypothetical protein